MKVDFVAEVSSNHNRNLERCFAFIDQATKIGCSAVKFQLFRLRELFAPEILERSEAHRRREHWELPVEFIPELAKYCHKAGINFACTPFYLQAVDELCPYVDFYKIASYELLWNELLRACARTGKPVVLSTGMATRTELTKAIAVLTEEGCQNLIVLHCVSGYPCPAGDCNLKVIETIRNEFDCSVGWSDHTVNPAVIYRAVHRWDADMVEFHLDLEGEGKEYSGGHCWLPEQIKPVIENVNSGFAADGNGKIIPAQSELSERDWRADPSDGLRPLMKIREAWQR